MALRKIYELLLFVTRSIYIQLVDIYTTSPAINLPSPTASSPFNIATLHSSPLRSRHMSSTQWSRVKLAQFPTRLGENNVDTSIILLIQIEY